MVWDSPNDRVHLRSSGKEKIRRVQPIGATLAAAATALGKLDAAGKTLHTSNKLSTDPTDHAGYLDFERPLSEVVPELYTVVQI